MRRRWIWWLAIACAVGCKRTPAPPSSVRIVMDHEPPTLNPLVEHDAWTTWLTLDAIYEPLLRQDPRTGELRPCLAASFDAPDDKSLHFVLRKDVRWHDGKPFTVEDAAAAFERLGDPGVGADQRADFADLARVERPSGAEITLRFTRPAPLALQAIAHLVILPAHLFPRGVDPKTLPLSRAPVGTGALRFVEWRPGESIALARNPDYWGAPARADRLDLRIVRDGEAAFALFQRGELDLVWRLSTSQVERAERAHLRLVGWRMPTYALVVWNLRRPGLADRRVREALALLTDRARWLQVAYRGRAQPTSGPYPLDSPSYDRAVAPLPYDPARARQLLDQAGVVDRDGDGVRDLDGKPFTITFLLVAGSKVMEPLATMMQEDFAKAGVRLEIAPTEWATLLDRLRQHAFDAAALQWNMQPVQDNYSLFHSSQAEGGQNYGGFRDPDTDALLDELKRTPPGPARVALDHKLHRRIAEEQPYLFLGAPEVVSALAPSLAGFSPSVDGLGLRTLTLAGAP